MTKSVPIQMVKRKGITVNLLVLTLFFSSLYFIVSTESVKASGDTLYVDDSGGADYTNIQDAIDAANESDTVFVYSGTYNENIVIGKEIKLLGSGISDVTINGNSDHTIKINTGGVQISSLTIKNTGDSFSCIILNSVSSCVISDNVIERGGNGIYVISSEGNDFFDNIFGYNNIGLYLSNSDNNEIKSNTFQNNNANAIFLTSSSSSNKIFLNDFNDWEDNGYPNARDDGSNSWDYNSQGNYWDDYNGYDSEPDGIGDDPYSIGGSGGNYDYYPLGDFLSLNQRPTSYIDSINPNPAIINQMISFNGHGSDDGSIVAWEWKINGNIVSTSEDFQKSDISSGTYNIGFRVQDDEEEWSDYVYQSLVVKQQSNTLPTAHISKPQSSTFDYGEKIEFDGSGTDSDGDSITGYHWRSEPESILSNDKSFSQSNIPVGDYTIYFKVRDSKGDWSVEISKTIKIISDVPIPENNPPVADTGGPYSSSINSIITFDGSGSYDPDIGDEIIYRWDFDDGSTGEGQYINHEFSSEGTYEVTLTVTDSHGKSSSSSVEVDISVNSIGDEINKEKNDTPGFELLFVILSILITIITKKRKIKF